MQRNDQERKKSGKGEWRDEENKVKFNSGQQKGR